jgi:hypothetical protein
MHQGRNKATTTSWLSTTPAKIMVVFVLWFWIQSFWALDHEQHIPAAVQLTKYLLVYYMFYRLADTPRNAVYILAAHLAGCFYLGLLAYTTDVSGRLDGIGGPGIDDSNTLGMHLATGVMAGAVLVLHEKKWRKIPVALGVVFSLNAIVMAGSRGAFLGLIAGGFALWALRPIEYRRQFLLCAAAGVLALGTVASTQFWERMRTVKAVAAEDSEQMDESAQSRLAMAKAQLKMSALYPLGAGHRGSEFLSAQYLERRHLTAGGARSSHNSTLTVLVEQGIPGIIMMGLLIAWVGRTLLTTKKAFRKNANAEAGVVVAAVGGALTVVIISGQFADFSKCEVQIWMLALLAAMYGHVAAEKKSVPADLLARPAGTRRVAS